MRQGVELSVIVVNWNTRDLLQDCLRSLYAESASVPLEVIVVDNHSADNSVAMVREQFPQVRVIENQDNLGFAYANNQGIAIASGKFILLVNSDVVVPEGTLSECLARMEDRSDIAMAGVHMQARDGKSQDTNFYRRFPTFIQFMLFYTLLDALTLRFLQPLVNKWWAKLPELSGEVDQVPGAFLMTRREVIDRIGTLDEDFFIFFEDVDWCYRARQSGGFNWFWGDLHVTHVGSASFAKWGSLRFMRQFFRSYLIYVRKHFPPHQRILIKPVLLLDSLLLIALALIALPFLWPLRGRFLLDRIRGRLVFIRDVIFASGARYLR